MKLNKNIFAITLGAALFVAMVGIVSMISVPAASIVASSSAINSAGSVEKATPIILASAHSLAAPRTNMAAGEAALPQSIPVPCPIWILGQLTGYSKTTVKTANGATPNPKLVPGGIWLMQKFSEAAAKTL
ncbi:MAG: hypothetical protein ACTSP0_05435 [Alphaproteobacteria bacterium]